MNFSNPYYAPFLALKELERQFTVDKTKHSQHTRKQLLSIGNMLNVFNKVKKTVVARYRNYVSIRELQKLDNRMLDDVGLSRSQVDSILAGLISIDAVVAERDKSRSRFNTKTPRIISTNACQADILAKPAIAVSNDIRYSDNAA